MNTSVVGDFYSREWSHIEKGWGAALPFFNIAGSGIELAHALDPDGAEPYKEALDFVNTVTRVNRVFSAVGFLRNLKNLGENVYSTSYFLKLETWKMLASVAKYAISTANKISLFVRNEPVWLSAVITPLAITMDVMGIASDVKDLWEGRDLTYENYQARIRDGGHDPKKFWSRFASSSIVTHLERVSDDGSTAKKVNQVIQAKRHYLCISLTLRVVGLTATGLSLAGVSTVAIPALILAGAVGRLGSRIFKHVTIDHPLKVPEPSSGG